MSEILDVDGALAPTTDGRTEVELPSGRGVVVVKSLTKGAMTRIRKKAGVGTEPDEVALADLEPLMFEEGLVEPKLSKKQVEQVFDTWPLSDVDAVIEAIGEASGMGAGFPEADSSGDGEE